MITRSSDGFSSPPSAVQTSEIARSSGGGRATVTGMFSGCSLSDPERMSRGSASYRSAQARMVESRRCSSSGRCVHAVTRYESLNMRGGAAPADHDPVLVVDGLAGDVAALAILADVVEVEVERRRAPPCRPVPRRAPRTRSPRRCRRARARPACAGLRRPRGSPRAYASCCRLGRTAGGVSVRADLAARTGRRAQMRPSRRANATACERLRRPSRDVTSWITFLIVRSE